MRTVILVALCMAVAGTGCGPDAVKNFGQVVPVTELQYSKGALGATMKFKNTKNVDAMLSGVKINKDTGDLEIGLLTLKDNASDVMAANVPQMQQIAAMYPLYTALQAQYGANAIGILKTIPEIIREIVPTLDKLIQVRGDVAMQNALRPTVFQQALGGVVGGHFTADLFNEVVKNIDPQLGADVLNAAKNLPVVPGVMKPISMRTTPPSSPLSGAGLSSPLDLPAPVDRAELASSEAPPAPSRDDVRRAFALSEGIQARLPETELVRFK